MDFSDAFPLFQQVGNLDHVLGNRLWHPLEVLYPLSLIVIFLLFGKVSFNLGREEITRKVTSVASIVQTFVTKIRIIAPFLFFVLLLIMIDIDDILHVLGVSSALRVSSHSPYYWLPLELVIFPLGSLVAFIIFGKVCYESGKSLR